MRLLLLCCLFTLGCTTISQVKPDFINTPEERAYLALVQQTNSGQFAEAVKAADQYEKEFPYSLQLQRARFQKAQALEGLLRWQEAAETYLAISNFSKKSQPEIAALSLYRLSFVYEALGDNQRVLTSLFDAQRLEQYLPPEVGAAEIPARLAMAYTKENNPDEAKRWLDEADRGLNRSLETRKEPLTGEWLARTYYNMGSVSTSHLNEENFLAVVQGQQAIQKYLFKSIQYNDPVWSAKAAGKLQDTFEALFQVAEKVGSTSAPPEDGSQDGEQAGGGRAAGSANPSHQTSSDPLVSAKEKKDAQIKLAGPLAELIDQGLMFQPGLDQISNSYQTKVFTYLRQSKVRVETLLEGAIYTPLIRRSNKPSPKLKTPDNVLKSEDPN